MDERSKVGQARCDECLIIVRSPITIRHGELQRALLDKLCSLTHITATAKLDTSAVGMAMTVEPFQCGASGDASSEVRPMATTCDADRLPNSTLLQDFASPDRPAPNEKAGAV